VTRTLPNAFVPIYLGELVPRFVLVSMVFVGAFARSKIPSIGPSIDQDTYEQYVVCNVPYVQYRRTVPYPYN
jgi:hypothetical protein